MKRIIVSPGTDLDVALTEAEAAGGSIELAHGGRIYQLVPATSRIDETEWERRGVLMERALAVRAKQQPLGITTAELIREIRAERYGE